MMAEMASQTLCSTCQTNVADPGFGIYVHWPFCRSKCPYCDFNSHVRERIDFQRWHNALLSELDHYAGQTHGRKVSSVFFGGGTPSLMPPHTVAALLQRVVEHWQVDPAVEVTLEANPTSAEAGRFAEFRAAGVNRLSLGVQALDDRALAFLGRHHSAAEALGAIALARRHFARFSFDLIYARPAQTVAAWRRELERALGEAPAHLSLYQLSIEPGTSFHAAQQRGELLPTSPPQAAALFEATQATMNAAGLPAYEISNHARAGAESRHNLTYWRYGDYLGVGPGAHGRLTFGPTKMATRQHRAPEAWLAAVEREGHATRARKKLDRPERLAELTMMGLRLAGGVAREAFRRESAREPEELFLAERLTALQEADYLVLDEAGLRATAAGRQRLDAVLRHLLVGAGSFS
jgi:oxygen-independent coproporphyrinogen-3 oxidase